MCKKICRKCGKELDIDSFYKHKKMADGRLNVCIDCTKSRVKKHRNENIERIREYDRERSKREESVLARKKYSKTEGGKISHSRCNKAYRDRYPLKYAAHTFISNAVKYGLIRRECKCSECESEYKVEAHHDDYSKPMEIRWLCELCHKQWHRENKPKY